MIPGFMMCSYTLCCLQLYFFLERFDVQESDFNNSYSDKNPADSSHNDNYVMTVMSSNHQWRHVIIAQQMHVTQNNNTVNWTIRFMFYHLIHAAS